MSKRGGFEKVFYLFFIISIVLILTGCASETIKKEEKTTKLTIPGTNITVSVPAEPPELTENDSIPKEPPKMPENFSLPAGAPLPP